MHPPYSAARARDPPSTPSASSKGLTSSPLTSSSYNSKTSSISKSSKNSNISDTSDISPTSSKTSASSESSPSSRDYQISPAVFVTPTMVNRAKSSYPLEEPDCTGPGECTARQIFPRMHLLQPGESVALDFEFQDFKQDGYKQGHRIGCVACTNTNGEIVFEAYFRYPKVDGVRLITPPAKFGVTVASLQLNNGAIPGDIGEAWLSEIMTDRTVVLHGGKQDRTAFFFEDGFSKAKEVVDTQDLYRGAALHILMAETFPETPAIQVNGHTAVEDATATMDLYLQKMPYDREAHKIALKKQGLVPVCKPSAEMVQQIKATRKRLADAARTFERNGGSRRT